MIVGSLWVYSRTALCIERFTRKGPFAFGCIWEVTSDAIV